MYEFLLSVFYEQDFFRIQEGLWMTSLLLIFYLADKITFISISRISDSEVTI